MPRRRSRQITNSPAAMTMPAPIEHDRARPGGEHRDRHHQRPQHRGVVERRDQRGLAETVALGEEDLAEASEDAGADQQNEVGGRRQMPAEGHGAEREQGGEQREIDDDGGGALVADEAPHLGRRERAEHRTADGEGGARDAALAGLGRARHDIVGEDDENAEQPDEHRRPPVDVNLLAEQEDGEHHRQERRGIADRGRVGDRQERQRRKAAEHGSSPRDRADHVLADVFSMEDRGELAAIADPDEDRDDREEAPEEGEFADRVAGAGELHQRRHDCERDGRGDLERDAEERPRGFRRVHGKSRTTTMPAESQGVREIFHPRSTRSRSRTRPRAVA